MHIKISEKIFKIANEIEETLNRKTYPRPDAYIPNRIRALATELRTCDSYAAEKASKIAGKADIFYSDRKHTKYRGGADTLWAEMIHDLLGRIRSQAMYRQSQGD